jgi:hypothetical protein
MVHVHHTHQPSSDFDPDDFDLEYNSPTTLPAGTPSQRARKNTATTTVTNTSAPLTSYTTITSNYLPPSSSSRPRRDQRGTGTTNSNARGRSWVSRLRSGTRHFLVKLSNLDPVKLAYLRTSFVFAISILITWTPSSINRVYTLIHPTRFNFGLNMASAVVLPLQGVWNAVIYCATSWYVLVDEVYDLKARVMGDDDGSRSGSGAGVSVGFEGFDGRRRRRPGARQRGFELSPTPRMSTMRVARDGSF